MTKKVQEVYINLDDSGKLTIHEAVAVYGGLVFFSKAEKDKYITQYRSIINDIKCSYCDHEDCCDHLCPEIKNTNIKPSHKRRLMNYIKKHYVVALIILNSKVYATIKNDKATRGRFTDYALRRMIKQLIKNLIRSGSIDPDEPLRLIINIDEQATKSNGYYNLRDGLLEELLYGISNFNYGTVFPPIINSDLDIVLSYQNSEKSYVVQSADLLAGTIRHEALESMKCNDNIYQRISAFADYVLILP